MPIATRRQVEAICPRGHKLGTLILFPGESQEVTCDRPNCGAKVKYSLGYPAKGDTHLPLKREITREPGQK